MVNPREMGLKKFAKSLLKRAKRHFKVIEPLVGDDEEVLEFEKSIDFEISKRYPKRNIKQKSYKEDDISSEDEFLYCDDCDGDHKGACPEHGPMLWVCDTRVPKNTPDRAELTVPSFLSIGRSSIPKAGLGIWTEIPLAKGTVFGPYKGRIIKDGKEAEKSGYAWMVWKGDRVDHYIEGVSKDVSNWMRFVNCADYEERQNMVAIQYRKQIYYRVYRNVLPYQELLVWYGGKYAVDLGISLKEEPEAADPISVEGVACDVCGSLFTSVESMESHRKRHPHQGHDRMHRCPQCPYSTDKAADLRRHLDVHTGERRHVCPHCHRAFTVECDLKRHVRGIHGGERAFSCGVCGREFTWKGDMQAHERTHTDTRPYRCNTCGRDFTVSANLRAHERLHTQQRPYRCTHCDYRATQLPHLNEHVIRVHTRQFPHTCDLCERGFLAPSRLKRHKEKVHPQ